MGDEELRLVASAEAEAEIVRGGRLCGAPVSWRPYPVEDPGQVREGPCTFAAGHDGEHSRP